MATIERDKKGRFTGNGETKAGQANLGVIAGAVGAGAALGVLAMLGRKAAVQAPTAFAGDWVEALTAEHKAVLKLFDTIEATEESATTKRTMLLAHLKHALTKHAIEEENVIYPALWDAGKQDAAKHLNKEHGEVKHYLYQLENMPKNSPEWLKTVRSFRADIERHMTEEETDLFPSLRAQLSEERNKALKALMNKEGFKVA